MTRIIHVDTDTNTDAKIGYDAGLLEGRETERRRILKIIEEMKYSHGTYVSKGVWKEYVDRNELIKLIEK